jgi:hypothetical protein
MGEFQQWFASQPFVTKWLTVFSLALPLIMKFQIIGVHWLVWDWYSISRKFQVSFWFGLFVVMADGDGHVPDQGEFQLYYKSLLSLPIFHVP